MNKEQKSKQQPKAKEEDGLIRKLVEYPQEVWDFLKEKKGLHVPVGNFSAYYFAKNLLPFDFVFDISQAARKKLFIKLAQALLPDFSSTVCRNFADGTLTEEDREILQDCATLMDEREEILQAEEGITDEIVK